MSSSDESRYSEPESGTDLDDPNLRDQDDEELRIQDEIELDESAEREARQVRLGPAQRRAADRELALRDMQERNAVLPHLLRQDLQRAFQNENLAQQLRDLQLQATGEDEQWPRTRETPQGLSYTTDPSRYFTYQSQRLAVEAPQSDTEFRQTLRDLRAQPTGALIEHAVVKALYFLKTSQRQDVTGATGQIPVPKYVERANELLGDQTRSSLEIEAGDLAAYNPDFVQFLVDSPGIALHVLDVAVTRFLLELEPALQAVHPLIRARVTVSSTGRALEALPEALRPVPLSRLDTQCVGRLVCARGVVVQRSARQARLVQLYVRCQTCGAVSGPIAVQAAAGVLGVPWGGMGGSLKKTQHEAIPRKCINAACGSTRLGISRESVYEDVVIATLQEGQDDVENGHVPHRRDVVLAGDLVTRAEPGSVLRVTGVYAAIPDNVPGLYATYATHIEANAVAFDGPGGSGGQGGEPGVDTGVANTTGDQNTTSGQIGIGLDGGEIRALQQLPRLFRDSSLENLLLRSLAPSLGKQETAKRALLCALIGGVSRRAGPGGPRTRGDIHLLLLGDPGVAKSQLLRAAGRAAPKSVLATGRGASAAGLTVAVRRDAVGTFSLQAGALVLASGGVCLVDELDKMTQVDRVALHQAMEQQEVSIAKAGIIATLPARAAVIAAANPISQRYNVTLPLQHNVDIGEALLSRFDLVVVMRDEIDAERDAELAKFIIASHVRAAGGATAGAAAGEVAGSASGGECGASGAGATCLSGAVPLCGACDNAGRCESCVRVLPCDSWRGRRAGRRGGSCWRRGAGVERSDTAGDRDGVPGDRGTRAAPPAGLDRGGRRGVRAGAAGGAVRGAAEAQPAAACGACASAVPVRPAGAPGGGAGGAGGRGGALRHRRRARRAGRLLPPAPRPRPPGRRPGGPRHPRLPQGPVPARRRPAPGGLLQGPGLARELPARPGAKRGLRGHLPA